MRITDAMRIKIEEYTERLEVAASVAKSRWARDADRNWHDGPTREEIENAKKNPKLKGIDEHSPTETQPGA